MNQMLVSRRPLFLVLLLAAPSWSTWEREVTVEVSAGKEECFYESVKAGQTIDVDYQVRAIADMLCGSCVSLPFRSWTAGLATR